MQKKTDISQIRFEYKKGSIDIKNIDSNPIKQFKKWIKESKAKKVVLVTHAPPYGTKLDDLYGESVGNISFRKFLVNGAVDMLLCGHLHENFNKKDMLNKTIIINAGPNGKIITI